MNFTMGSRPMEAPAGLEPATLAKQLLTRSRHLSYGAVCRAARGVDKRRGLGNETVLWYLFTTLFAANKYQLCENPAAIPTHYKAVPKLPKNSFYKK